ncbi:MAG: nucleoside triphosphate pyrophosphohydrolase [Chitinophagia bacterium]|jgi:MazG family protein|nr:nucleoside triphosphate pyrophosphohydrolase [Chitinophagia bacterium]
MQYNKSLDRLLQIMEELRAQCPWDQKQTIESLRPLTIEETYELCDAIIKKDWNGLKEELGDVLLHLVFYAKIASEQNQFNFNDVIEAVCNKLVYRHPHIYSNVKVSNEQEVKENWEKLKQKERKKSVLSGVPDALPALIKALRIQDKSKQVGFEWDTTAQVQAKVKEELDELQEAMEENNQDHIEEEFGDVLFSLVNLARFLKVDPELALERTNRKFMDRFNKMEVLAEENGKSLLDMNLEEMDALWNFVKSKR